MNVSACLVTRGDVDMRPVVDSLPPDWEILIWANGRTLTRVDPGGKKLEIVVGVPDLSVYGRYAAIEYASHDLIFIQDDDVIVHEPQAIVTALVTRVCPDCGALDHQQMTDDSWICHTCGCVETLPGAVVCNMPPLFRPNYPDAALVGFGAAFHRDAPARAFARFDPNRVWETCRTWPPSMGPMPKWAHERRKLFLRECDRVFTVLTPRVLVDVGKTDREFATSPDRLYRDPEHHSSTARMLDWAREVRDA